MINPATKIRARILIVDDHGIVRDGVAVLLETDPSLAIIGSVGTGHESVRLAENLHPDIVVMDLVLPDISGIDATERILRSSPRCRVVILSASQSAEHIYRARRAGAMGYVSKHAVVGEIVDAVERVLAGERYLSPSLAHLDGSSDGASTRSPIERLTLREREILQRICAGASSAEIARNLFLSRKTIDTYRGRLMSKLGVANRAALIRFAIEHELTTP